MIFTLKAWMPDSGGVAAVVADNGEVGEIRYLEDQKPHFIPRHRNFIASAIYKFWFIPIQNQVTFTLEQFPQVEEKLRREEIR